MPPRKRMKKEATAETVAPSSPFQPSEQVHILQSQDAQETDNTLNAQSLASADSALLDEEEIPWESEDIAQDGLLEGSSQDRQAMRDAAGRGGYNMLKSYKGQVYSGMAVGGSHTWKYDEGVWKETKEEPDLWKIDYRATKRRIRKAPKASGAPIGTEYHWFIVGHQHVKKIDANTYETTLTGSKYKLAHKSAASGSWSVPTVKAQREREIELLEDAKQRVQGLPPVLRSEKVKVAKQEKGQQKLDSLFEKSRRCKVTNTTEGEEKGDFKEK